MIQCFINHNSHLKGLSIRKKLLISEQRPLPPTKLKSDSYFYFLLAPEKEPVDIFVYGRGYRANGGRAPFHMLITF
jgi:hypothetical protein